MPWSAAPMASPIRPKFQISNVGHVGTLSIRNFLLMLKEPKGQWSQRPNLYDQTTVPILRAANP
jgi:hypothetical protein